ncbi:hypothetical protein BAE44_0025587 [Dichanthelium oligosanthes]|uniref:Bacterial surface antigen (D15) domain-containing protein n=1 Tax=Dichanthelium oligosanthes TaxID=888268 RepID=A0A1E5UKJ0_9POAL|nr:hypothetical protein BAE44_0025587 [Dichanthelium oligosanthes]
MAIAADSTTDQAPNPAPDEAAGGPVDAPAQPDHGEPNAEAADEEYEEEEELDGPAAEAAERERILAVLRRLSEAPVGIRVHDVTIQGNTRTRDALIEAEVVDLIRSATTVQGLMRAASIANARLRRFDARSWSVEGSLKLKNIFGYGDIWDASGAYGWDQSSEIGIGVSLPRFRSIPTPLMARASLLSHDWLKFSSYKERLLGLSFGLLSTVQHDLSYNLTWRTLTDPSQMASKSTRRQLGHNLLSAMKYRYTIDQRDPHLRPTKGYAFVSTLQVGGLWGSKGLRFFCQEFDVRGAVPFGFYNAALNAGISAGVILPLGRGFMESPSSVPHRFFLGGHSSPVCSLGGLTSLLGFKTRGIGPTELWRFIPSESVMDDSAASPGRDYLGGDLAISAFADLSFDLPLKSSAGVGVILPTKLFRMEINYCYILKQSEHDREKTGMQFTFSSPMWIFVVQMCFYSNFSLPMKNVLPGCG